MSMPAAFKVLGVIPALLIITIIGWLSTISVGFLMKSTLAGEATTYAGVMKESFGKTGSVAVQVATMVATFGCMVIFSIIIGRLAVWVYSVQIFLVLIYSVRITIPPK